MPLKVGTKNVIGLAVGTNSLLALYKGTTLLYQSASWELYSKTYFYNELVPTTINSKNVLNKAKIVKVSGNGAIENQLVQISNLRNIDAYGVSIVNNGDGSITINGTYTGSSTNFLSLLNNNISIQANHRYLLFGGKSTANIRFYDGYGAYVDNGSGVLSGGNATTSSQTITLVINVGATFNNVRIYPQITDLTHREGTGNEPTTLTDNRIQNILNRGYIAFNLGKYKESDIGVVSSEPYNLLSDIEIGTLSASTGEDVVGNTDTFKTDFIKVQSGKAYTFENGTFTSPTIHELDLFEYDENQSFIKRSAVSYNPNSSANKQTSISIGSSTKYIRMTFYSSGTNWNNTPLPTTLCFHLTGTRTGYAPHKTFTPITFKAQLGGAINSHNTMEITNSAYVFTRNVGSVDLGTLNYTYQTQQQRFYSNGIQGKNPDNDANYIPNMLSSNFVANSINGISENQMTYYNNLFFIKGSDLGTTNQEAQAYLNGKYIHYELATPQVITIPKKHLGIVDLGSLTGYVSNDKYFISAEHLGISTASSNNNGYSCYCEDYMVDSGYNVYNKTTDKTMCLTSPFIGGNFIIWDSSFVGKTAQEIKALLSGKYLFYETENEVADIDNVVDIESGGTITTDSEVLPNIELSIKGK